MAYTVILLKQTCRHDFKAEFSEIITNAVAGLLPCKKEDVEVNILEFDSAHFGVGGVLDCNSETPEQSEFCTLFNFLPPCSLETKQAIGAEICARFDAVGFPAVNSRISFHELPAETCCINGKLQ